MTIAPSIERLVFTNAVMAAKYYMSSGWNDTP